MRNAEKKKKVRNKLRKWRKGEENKERYKKEKIYRIM